MRRAWPLAAALTALAGCGTPEPSIQMGPDAVVTSDGLHKVDHTILDLVFMKPGADLGAYDAILLDPVEISYQRTRDDYRLRAEDLERMQRYFHERVTRELERDNGYRVVTEPGPRVLRARAAIVDVKINAPTRPPIGRDRTFVMSAGEMTLVVELRDSQSGEPLVRAGDRRNAREYLHRIGPVSTWNDVKVVFDFWATLFRDRLDALHGRY